MTDAPKSWTGPVVHLPAQGSLVYRERRRYPALSALVTLLKDLSPPRVRGIDAPMSQAHAGETYRFGKGWERDEEDGKKASPPKEKRLNALLSYCEAANEVMTGPSLVHQAVRYVAYEYGKPPPASRKRRPTGSIEALRLWRQDEARWLQTEVERLRAGLSKVPDIKDARPAFALFERMIGVIAGLPRPVPMTWGLSPASTPQDLGLLLLVPPELAHARAVLSVSDDRLSIDQKKTVTPDAHQQEVALSQALASAIAASHFQHDLRQVSVHVAHGSTLPDSRGVTTPEKPLIDIAMTPRIWRNPPTEPLTRDNLATYPNCD